MLSIPKAKCSACINCTLLTWEKDKHAETNTPAESVKDVVHSKNYSICKCVVICLAFTLFDFFWEDRRYCLKQKRLVGPAAAHT